jgi:hypothetical protein
MQKNHAVATLHYTGMKITDASYTLYVSIPSVAHVYTSSRTTATRMITTVQTASTGDYCPNQLW